jgi:hypothetical protein
LMVKLSREPDFRALHARLAPDTGQRERKGRKLLS